MNQVKPMGTNTENNLTQFNEESYVAIAIDLTEVVKLDGKMTLQKLDYSTCCNLNKHNETMLKEPMFQLDDTFNQHKRKETTKRVPYFVIFPTLCLWILLVTRSLTTSTRVQPLHKEHGSVSIGAPLLELFSFIVFVWAVATMILVGAKFTSMHGAMLLFWAILMHVRSDNSTSALYLSILGIFFIGWYAVCSWKANNQMEGEKLSSTVELGSSLNLRR